MTKFVVKKDGSKEPFDIEKLRRSIIVNAQDAALPEKRVQEVTMKVLSAVARFVKESEKELATAEIKKKILSEFDAVEPSVSEAWRKFDESRGVTIM